MKSWRSKMAEIHCDIASAADDAAVIAKHHQWQAASWHEMDPTIETQRESARWHASFEAKLDAWIEADDRLRAMDAARGTAECMLDELTEWRKAAAEAMAMLNA